MSDVAAAATTSASTTSAAPAATPAPSAPAISPSSADTPSSFGEALSARLTAPAPVTPESAAPASEPSTPAASAPVTAEATTPAPAAPAAETRGPIPYDRHERILQNARQKTADEIGGQFQQRYGAHVELGNQIQTDPVGTVVGLVNSLAEHPEYGHAVISALARTLGSRRGVAAANEEPQPDLQTADGTLVYSAPQLAKWNQWNQSKFQQQIAQQLEPLQAREQQRVAEERLTQAKTEAMQRMARVIEPYRKLLPDFDRHKPALLQQTRELLAEGYDAQTALGLAVINTLNSTVVPAQAAHSQQQLVAQAVAKATGSTSAPGTAAAAPASRPRDFAEAFGRVKV